MNLEKIIEEYLPKFKEFKFGKYDQEYINKNECVDFGARDGIHYFYELIKKEIPPFKNIDEITCGILTSYLRGSLEIRERVANKVDLSLTLYKNYTIMKAKNEYQIKKLIPNLEDIITKIVKKELNKHNETM